MISRKQTIQAAVHYGAQDIDNYVVTPVFTALHAVNMMLEPHDETIQYAVGHVIHGFLYLPLFLAQMMCDDGEAEENWDCANAITETCNKIAYTSDEEVKEIVLNEYHRLAFALGVCTRVFLNNLAMVKSYTLYTMSREVNQLAALPVLF